MSTPAASRLTSLDAIRGVAVAGILVMNAAAFALGEGAYFNPAERTADGPVDQALGIFARVLADQKFMGLFSLAFGASFLLFAEKAEAKRPGRSALGIVLWRNALLFLIGLAHTYLWVGDILTIYALSALALIPARRAPQSLLATLGTVLFLLPIATALWAQQSVGPLGEGLGDRWFNDGGTMSEAVEIHVLTDWVLRSIGGMLLGMAAYRSGFLTGSLRSATYWRVAAFGLAVGVPLSVAGAVWEHQRDYSPDIALIGAIPGHLGTLPMTLAYAALIILANRSPHPVMVRFRAMGKMALTNYISHSALGVAVFGFLLGGTEPAFRHVALFIVTVWALQLVVSPLWLRHFSQGPLEWLWRRATYRNLR